MASALFLGAEHFLTAREAHNAIVRVLLVIGASFLSRRGLLTCCSISPLDWVHWHQCSQAEKC